MDHFHFFTYFASYRSKYSPKSGSFRTGTSSASQLNSYIGNYPSLYKRGSKEPLIRAILDHFSVFDLFSTIQIEVLTKKCFFGQEPQMVGSTQTWPTNPDCYSIGSKGPLIRAILDNFSLFAMAMIHRIGHDHQAPFFLFLLFLLDFLGL